MFSTSCTHWISCRIDMDVLATKEYRDSSEYLVIIDAIKCSTVIFLARWFKDELKSLGF